jgi:hypothetical protein
MVEFICEPDKVHLPVNPSSIKLRYSNVWLDLGLKPDLAYHARAKGSKRVFSADRLKLYIGDGVVEIVIKLELCLLDPATTNPLIDVEKAKYRAGFAQLILNSETGKHSLRIPVILERSMKTQESRKVESKNRFHSALPGEHLVSNMQHLFFHTNLTSSPMLHLHHHHQVTEEEQTSRLLLQAVLILLISLILLLDPLVKIRIKLDGIIPNGTINTTLTSQTSQLTISMLLPCLTLVLRIRWVLNSETRWSRSELSISGNSSVGSSSLIPDIILLSWKRQMSLAT